MNKPKNKLILIPAIVAIISILSLIGINLFNNITEHKSYSEFLKDLNTSSISTVYITNATSIDVQLNDGTSYKTDNPNSIDFKERLLASGIKVSPKSANFNIELIPTITLGVSLISILFIFLKSSSIATKSLASVDSLDLQAVSGNKFNFETVAGNEEAKESVKDIVDFLKNPEKYSTYGARMPRGIILYGEPGTGKTLLAKAVAGEANVPFYAMSGSDFVQVYVGVGASRIRSLFKKAKSHGKAVIFIDEIDAIGKARDNGKAGGSDERDQTLNALLTEMSGFNDNDGIIVMAATNRLDMLDAALLRPGRFDRHIEIMLPDVAAREKILNLHFKNKPIGSEADIKELASKTTFFSGAKLENLANEAAILACKEESGYISANHLDKAFSIVVAGHEKLNREGIKEKDRKITAYHEAGHALISMLVLPQDKVSKVTIIPSTKGAGGYTLSIPEDNMYQTIEYLKNRIMVLLGGRAAEEIIFGKTSITTGAYSDLQHSTNLITKIVTEYGMGETLGLLNLHQLSGLNNIDSTVILNECKDSINHLYTETKELLTREITLLEKITVNLLEKETLLAEDLEKLVYIN
jgi:cell division protease FtsH